MTATTELDNFDPNHPGLAINRLVVAWPRLFHGAVPEWSYLDEGWFDITSELCRQFDALITDIEAASFKIDQIKEKFGRLRFYYRLDEEAGTERSRAATMDRLGDVACKTEALSGNTCLRCGKPGTCASFGGWRATLCPEHAVDRESGKVDKGQRDD